MGEAARLRIVPPAPAEPVDIAAQWRAEVKARDWGRVHVEGDRNPPVNITRTFGRWSWPVSRKGRG